MHFLPSVVEVKLTSVHVVQWYHLSSVCINCKLKTPTWKVDKSFMRVKKVLTFHGDRLKRTDRDFVLYIPYIFFPSIYPPANAPNKTQFTTNY
jgi:hypothetical protein